MIIQDAWFALVEEQDWLAGTEAQPIGTRLQKAPFVG